MDEKWLLDKKSLSNYERFKLKYPSAFKFNKGGNTSGCKLIIERFDKPITPYFEYYGNILVNNCFQKATELWIYGEAKAKEILKYRLKRKIRDLSECIYNLEHKPYDYDVGIGYSNHPLNEGYIRVWNLAIGGGGTTYSNATAQIGVGDNDTDPAYTQTGLLASTNKYYSNMSVSFPAVGTNRDIEFKGSVPNGSGQFHWREFEVRNGAVADESLVRIVDDRDVKVSGDVWNPIIVIQIDSPLL